MHQKYEYKDLLTNVPMLPKGPSDFAVRAHGNEMYGDKMTVTERAKLYLAENPQVYTAFKTYAFQLIRAGRSHIGAKMIAERIRFDSMVSSDTGTFKLNNNAVALMARKFMQDYPEHEGIFETRSSC